MLREPLPGITPHHHPDRAHITTITGATLTGPPATDFVDNQPHITQNHRHITHYTQLLDHIAADTTDLAAHLRESVDNIAAAKTAATPHPRGRDLWETATAHHPNAGVYFEQLVVIGHPIHPMARTRGGLTTRQVQAWAPEHHPTVQLILARPHTPTRHHGDWPWRDQQGKPLLPMHPYQAHRYRDHIDIITTQPAAPLMSLRTLAPHHQPHLHIKTAVDLQMTSAVRRVSPAAIHNGPLLTQHITHLATPDFAVHAETASLTALSNQHPDPRMTAIIRTLPPATHNAYPIPLAALAEPDPATGTPLIATVIDAGESTPTTWWEKCVPLILTGPLTLATRHGIDLEAHGQNTLLEVVNAQPHRLIYRDFGGVRTDPTIADLTGDIPQTDPRSRHTTLIAALYSTIMRQLIHALSHHYQTDPATWWQPVIEHSHRLTHPNPLLHDMLFDDTWPLKATTAMRLAPDPLDNQWTPIPNPIAGTR